MSIFHGLWTLYRTYYPIYCNIYIYCGDYPWWESLLTNTEWNETGKLNTLKLTHKATLVNGQFILSFISPRWKMGQTFSMDLFGWHVSTWPIQAPIQALHMVPLQSHWISWGPTHHCHDLFWEGGGASNWAKKRAKKLGQLLLVISGNQPGGWEIHGGFNGEIIYIYKSSINL